MTIQASIDKFIQWLSTERNMAPSTVGAYRYELGRWLQFVVERDAKKASLPSKIEAFDLKDYLAWLKEENNCKAAAIARVVSTLRQFFGFLTAEGLVDGDPASGLRTPKKARKLPIYLTAGEASRLAHSPAEDSQEANSQRDDTIIGLMMMTGMRLSELVGLDIDFIDFETQTLKVFGKGRKERLIPLNSGAEALLRTWLEERSTLAVESGCRAVFLSKDGGRIKPRSVQYLVKKGVKRTGLDRRISPHKLRHTFATTLYAEAVDLRDIQELLGHASIVSTSVYTHTNVEKVRAAVNKLKVR